MAYAKLATTKTTAFISFVLFSIIFMTGCTQRLGMKVVNMGRKMTAIMDRLVRLITV